MLPGLDLFGGGGSNTFDGGGVGNSASTNNNHDEQFEVGVSTTTGNASFVRDERSYSVSVTGNGNTTTDYGAVSDSLAAALAGVEQANATAQAINTSAGQLVSGALSMVGKQQTEFTGALEKVKLGNSDSMLIVVGLAVLAVGAVAIFRKG